MILWTSISIVASGIMSVFAWTTIRKSVIEKSESSARMQPVQLPRFIAAFLLVAVAQAVYAIACVSAMLARKVAWRGVTYSIQNRNVELDRYRPYEGNGESKHSI